MSGQDKFGLYVHWPYCEALCPYCSFNTYVGNPDTDAWRRAYRDALNFYSQETDYRSCMSIYFGGGTPSLMDAGLVGAILDTVDSNWVLEKDAEITLEANPTSSESRKFRDYRSQGVNRLSIGVQSLRDPALSELGRLHTASEARMAFDMALVHYENVSIDLIFGRQHQNLGQWIDELAEACSWGAEHLSLYQLSVEPGTAFGKRQESGRLPGLPDDDLAAEMMTETAALCAGFGLRQYEVSNFARPGREGVHNLVYWRCGNYIGIGPGAHGRISVGGERFATESELSPASWLSMVDSSGNGESRRTRLDRHEQAREFLMMSLRLAEGTDIGRYVRLAGRDLDRSVVSELDRCGLVRIEDGHLKASTTGMLVLNRIISELLD